MSNPFENPTIRDWFFSQANWIGKFPDGIVTLGSGPFNQEDFDEFLESKGIQLRSLKSDVDILVIGQFDWDGEDLDDHIESRKGKNLYVYSQEMFLAFLSSSINPYDNKYYNEEVLLSFGDEHPGLLHLQEWGFDWPRTSIVQVNGGGRLVGTDIWPQVGLLKHMGYHVGINAPFWWEREEILRIIFTSSIPNVISRDYMEQWGTPGSSERLLKLANSIASFARIAKRKSDSPLRAVEDWERDLDWLKKTFYHGRFTFPWPTTFVR